MGLGRQATEYHPALCLRKARNCPSRGNFLSLLRQLTAMPRHFTKWAELHFAIACTSLRSKPLEICVSYAYTEIPKTITHYTKSLYFINYQRFASVQYQSSHYTDTTPHYTRVVWCSIRVVSLPTLHSHNHIIINHLQYIRVVCNKFRKIRNLSITNKYLNFYSSV